MQKQLLRFYKKGPVKFIGHLDLLRVFQQSLRRSGLPVCYSQGFNPHILISFALPLPLGMESVNDYAEIVLAESLPGDETAARLNPALPDGIQITGVWPMPENRRGPAARVTAADYLLALPAAPKAEGAAADAWEAAASSIRDASAIVVSKKTKSGMKDTDIRPDILAIQMREGEVYMRLNAGSARFLSPNLVARELMTRRGIPFTPHRVAMTRLELFRGAADAPGELVSLGGAS